MDGPALEIDYDLDYVKARDRARRALARRRVYRALLLPLYPLLGLLPSRWKETLQERYGVHPRTMTGWSIWLEFAAILLHVMFLALNTWTGIFDRSYLLAVLLVLSPDALMRWSSLLGEDAYPPGFYEWILRFRLW